MQTHRSYLPLYYNSQGKQFLKEILRRKSHCIMINGKFRTLSNISHGAFERKSQQVKFVTYFCEKLHHRSLTRF